MKKIALLCSFFLLVFSPLMAQTPVPDSRLSEVFSEKYIERALFYNPQVIDYWNYYLDHSYEIVDGIPADKLATYQDLAEVVKTKQDFQASLSENDFNVLMFAPILYKDKESAYRMGDTGKLIVFYSKDDFLAAFNAASDITE